MGTKRTNGISKLDRLRWGLPRRYELTKLDLHKGDWLVARADVPLNLEQLKQLKKLLQRMVPKGVKVVVLSSWLVLAAVPDPKRFLEAKNDRAHRPDRQVARAMARPAPP